MVCNSRTRLDLNMVLLKTLFLCSFFDTVAVTAAFGLQWQHPPTKAVGSPSMILWRNNNMRNHRQHHYQRQEKNNFGNDYDRSIQMAGPLFSSKQKQTTHSSAKKKQKKKRFKNRNKKQQRQQENIAGDQTWRIFGVEVKPIDYNVADIEKYYSSRKKESQNWSKDKNNVETDRKFLTKPVIDALFKKLRISRDDTDNISSISSYDHSDDGKEKNGGSRIPSSIILQGEAILLPKQVSDIRVVRRSLDARKKRNSSGGPTYVFVLDIDINDGYANEINALKYQPGSMELLPQTYQSKQKKETKPDEEEMRDTIEGHNKSNDNSNSEKRVIIVGAGPAGLFCALTLIEKSSHTKQKIIPILIERGLPVELRGKDISGLQYRARMNKESNFAFGEGGAGTWSDGKLTTRIGRNSDDVRKVLETFVKFGGPDNILIEGAPHLGTDNLVRLLRNMRRYIVNEKSGQILFDTKMVGIQMIDKENNSKSNDSKNDGVAVFNNNAAKGVHVVQGTNTIFNQYQNKNLTSLNIDTSVVTSTNNEEIATNPFNTTIAGDVVVLATGHSARDVYRQLHDDNLLQLEPKGFAVGFRIEHPQKVINQIQYNNYGKAVITGKPSTDRVNREYFHTMNNKTTINPAVLTKSKDTNNNNLTDDIIRNDNHKQHDDQQKEKEHYTDVNLPVPSYRLAVTKDQIYEKKSSRYKDGMNEKDQNSNGTSINVNNSDEIVASSSSPTPATTTRRGVYSFCMCPGGQIVPASTDPDEVCVNGMSYSRRDSLWANSALVVTISPNDTVLVPYQKKYGDIMAGVEFQRDMERRAAAMGGGNFTVPVQRVTDYINRSNETDSSSVTKSPLSSSYKLGIKSSPCHEIYPQPINDVLVDALVNNFNKSQMPGFVCDDGILHGVETRTSSPIRVARDPIELSSIGINNLYPAGEGAGFAGGIVSAAVDGIHVAEAIIEKLQSQYSNIDSEDANSDKDEGEGNRNESEKQRKRRQKNNSLDSYY